MRNLWKKWLIAKGGRLCAFVVSVASIAPFCCRGHYYEPEEPEGLEEFLKIQTKG